MLFSFTKKKKKKKPQPFLKKKVILSMTFMDMNEIILLPNGIQPWWRHKEGQKLQYHRSERVSYYSDAKPEHNLHIHSKAEKRKKKSVNVKKKS